MKSSPAFSFYPDPDGALQVVITTPRGSKKFFRVSAQYEMQIAQLLRILNIKCKVLNRKQEYALERVIEAAKYAQKHLTNVDLTGAKYK